MKRANRILFLILLVVPVAILFFQCNPGEYIVPLKRYVIYPLLILAANIAFISLTKFEVWCGLCPLMVSSSFLAFGLKFVRPHMSIVGEVPFIHMVVRLLTSSLAMFLIPLAGGFIYKQFLTNTKKVF